MNKLKVIFANRKNCHTKPGGDTVQMTKTKEYLEKNYPIEIKICLSPEEILQDNEAQIVHIFNLETINETNAFIDAAKKKNKKIILSTIHWNLLDNYYIRYLEVLNIPPIQTFDFIKKILVKIFNIFILFIPQLRNKYKDFIKKGLFCTSAYKNMRRKALRNVDMILPNSREEMYLCADDFKLSREYIANKSIVIPNATDINATINENILEDLHLPSKYVLLVGGIYASKNQYNVVRALNKDEDIGIVIVGQVRDRKTKTRIEKLANKRGNVYFIDWIEHHKLIYLYKNALCHCLVSFCDTTGLASLEALLCGCPIVVSDKKYCPIDFYKFNSYGKICNPYNLNSIRNAILSTINQETRPEVSVEYRNMICYDNVAKLTYGAYLKLLN